MFFAWYEHKEIRLKKRWKNDLGRLWKTKLKHINKVVEQTSR